MDTTTYTCTIHTTCGHKLRLEYDESEPPDGEPAFSPRTYRMYLDGEQIDATGAHRRNLPDGRCVYVTSAGEFEPRQQPTPDPVGG